MLKKEHTFRTSYADSKAVIDFLNLYKIEYIQEFEMTRTRFTTKLTSREFGAFADYIADLAKLRVYPILL